MMYIHTEWNGTLHKAEVTTKIANVNAQIYANDLMQKVSLKFLEKATIGTVMLYQVKW